MLIDSHCHLDCLDLERLGLSLDEVIAQAKSSGVEKILSIGIDLVNAAKVLSIADEFEDVYASVGLHPSEKVTTEPVKADYLPLIDHPKVVALGEMGLDYHYNQDGLAEQRDRFRLQIQLAHQVKKPIIIHTRAAQDDTLSIMREESARDVGGVMHCFTESVEMAKQCLDLGFYVSISGIVTFKKADNVRDVARLVPLDRLLIETDAPYLTPVPFRGKPNQPAHVKYVAEKMAELKGVSVEQIAKVTTDNFNRLFFSAS